MFVLVLVVLLSAAVVSNLGEAASWRDRHDFLGNFYEKFPVKIQCMVETCGTVVRTGDGLGTTIGETL